MERCFEYFNCKKTDCIAHNKTNETKCWDLKDTQCVHPLFEHLKVKKCSICLYFKTTNTRYAFYP